MKDIIEVTLQSGNRSNKKHAIGENKTLKIRHVKKKIIYLKDLKKKTMYFFFLNTQHKTNIQTLTEKKSVSQNYSYLSLIL